MLLNETNGAMIPTEKHFRNKGVGLDCRKLSCDADDYRKDKALRTNEPCWYLSFPSRFVTMDLIFIEIFTRNLIIIATVVTTTKY